MLASNDDRYRALLPLREAYGWSINDLSEALRQEWEISYGRRGVTDGGLRPYEVLAQQPPSRGTKVIRRRRLLNVEGNGNL